MWAQAAIDAAKIAVTAILPTAARWIHFDMSAAGNENGVLAHGVP